VVALPPPRIALVPNAIAFRSPTYGIVGTGLCKATCTGTVSLTTDGGRTWKVLLKTPRPVVSVNIQGRTEQARFDDGETIGSSDEGKTWAPVVVPIGLGEMGPCPAGTVAYQIVGWALCITQAGAGNQGKAVYRLTLRGWKRVAYTPFGRGGYGGISMYGYPQGIAMATDGFGLIWESRGTLYVTRDAGRHWLGLPTIAQPEIDFGISGVALWRRVGFVILARGWVHRRLLETTDAGRSWHVVHTWS
jgi:hypothetical protein